MKHHALFSSKDKRKKLKCRLLPFLFGALRVKDRSRWACCYGAYAWVLPHISFRLLNGIATGIFVSLVDFTIARVKQKKEKDKAKRTFGDKLTSFRRRCDVITSH